MENPGKRTRRVAERSGYFTVKHQLIQYIAQIYAHKRSRIQVQIEKDAVCDLLAAPKAWFCVSFHVLTNLLNRPRLSWRPESASCSKAGSSELAGQVFRAGVVVPQDHAHVAMAGHFRKLVCL